MSYLPKEPFTSWSQMDQDECLVVEELCRVIADARRFQTITEAWRAIITTRRKAKQIRSEMVGLYGSGDSEQPTSLSGGAISKAGEGGGEDGE
jgi:hypothetical protein